MFVLFSWNLIKAIFFPARKNWRILSNYASLILIIKYYCSNIDTKGVNLIQRCLIRDNWREFITIIRGYIRCLISVDFFSIWTLSSDSIQPNIFFGRPACITINTDAEWFESIDNWERFWKRCLMPHGGDIVFIRRTSASQ